MGPRNNSTLVVPVAAVLAAYLALTNGIGVNPPGQSDSTESMNPATTPTPIPPTNARSMVKRRLLPDQHLFDFYQQPYGSDAKSGHFRDQRRAVHVSCRDGVPLSASRIAFTLQLGDRPSGSLLYHNRLCSDESGSLSQPPRRHDWRQADLEQGYGFWSPLSCRAAYCGTAEHPIFAEDSTNRFLV
jgi:hypothetical protein